MGRFIAAVVGLAGVGRASGELNIKILSTNAKAWPSPGFAFKDVWGNKYRHALQIQMMLDEEEKEPVDFILLQQAVFPLAVHNIAEEDEYYHDVTPYQFYVAP
jgi:hypothetical protein